MLPQQQQQRNFSHCVYLRGYFLYEVSASAFEMSEQRLCGQWITVILPGSDWTAPVRVFLQRVSVFVLLYHESTLGEHWDSFLLPYSVCATACSILQRFSAAFSW